MSNVFNDVLELDSGNGNITLLKGIAARSDVGFLSLFEHYSACQVPGAPLPAPAGRVGELWELGCCRPHRGFVKKCGFVPSGAGH